MEVLQPSPLYTITPQHLRCPREFWSNPQVSKVRKCTKVPKVEESRPTLDT
ncbi:MAG: hypothetical protein QME81_10540 [bacterium]|nr:hypothetical protein [bacterium]